MSPCRAVGGMHTSLFYRIRVDDSIYFIDTLGLLSGLASLLLICARLVLEAANKAGPIV